MSHKVELEAEKSSLFYGTLCFSHKNNSLHRISVFYFTVSYKGSISKYASQGLFLLLS